MVLKMYKTDRQISLAEFQSPFGKLNENNRWVQIANMIPWEKYEKRYAERFCSDNGAPAKPFRMAMGALIIKQRTGHSDDEVVNDVLENPYMQFLIGLHEFVTEPPFSQSSMTSFRKYITQEMIDEINEDLFRPKKKDDDDDTPSSGDKEECIDENKKPENKGSLLLDATCAPANMAYPTDINLLNEAREKLEGIIDTLHRNSEEKIKPRTYRQEARKRYLRFVKQRKPRKNTIRKARGQQLRYVRRNLNHIEKQLEKVSTEALSTRQKVWLETIKELYAQQEEMHRTRTFSIENRIVSISQPWVRPIVRGKAKCDTEFGAKVTISMVDGFAFVDKLSWDAYNEESLLIPAVTAYYENYGVYPETVLADKLFRNRKNLAFCKKHGIRLSGPRLGRQTAQTKKLQYRQERKDASARNAVEGKFGEGKTKYGLDRIMARLQRASETVISMVFLCMNISHRLRVLLPFFLWQLFSHNFAKKSVDNFLQKRLFYNHSVFE